MYGDKFGYARQSDIVPLSPGPRSPVVWLSTQPEGTVADPRLAHEMSVSEKYALTSSVSPS